MSVRVVTRIRPLLKSEIEKDTIVEAVGSNLDSSRPTAVKIPNPKNFSETYTFQFNSVYGQQSSQQELFDAEGRILKAQVSQLVLTALQLRRR